MIQVIDVFEEDFDFNATSLEVAENMPIGSSVGQMIQTAGSEGVVSYHFNSYQWSTASAIHAGRHGRISNHSVVGL